MSDPIQKVGPRTGTLQEILMHIPGFQGYVKQEYRRDADKIQRDFLASRLKKAKEAVDRVKTAQSRKGAFAQLTRLESLTDQLYRVTSRIENADRGYSGFFDSRQIGEAELQSLYELDCALLGEVDAVSKQVETLEAAGSEEDSSKAIDETGKAIEALDRKFDRRKQVIEGVV